MTYVLVDRLPFGLSSYSECVADVFERDTLTITCPDQDDRIVKTFAPGTWQAATVIEVPSNHPLYGFVSAHASIGQRAAFDRLQTKGAA